MLYDGDTFTHNGREFRVSFPYDAFHGAPWVEYDCHGPVSDWTTRDKAPGELILNNGRTRRVYYDFQEACRIARTVWGFTSRADAAKAARADYERLRQWCADQWHYVFVRVELLDDNGSEIDWQCVGGVESDAGDYLEEIAREIAGELCANHAAPEYSI